MGSSQSALMEKQSIPDPETPPTLDDLLRRYTALVIQGCFTIWFPPNPVFTFDHSLRPLFDAHCVPGPENPCWTESIFLNQLSLLVPPELLDAGPILFRLLLRLGSFPYHQLAYGDTLTFDCFVVGLAHLTGRYWLDFWPLIRGKTRAARYAQVAKKRTRLLFQCMRDHPDAEDAADSSVDEREDVITMLETFRMDDHTINLENPKIPKSRSLLPDPSDLPSSHSDSVGGQVPQAALRPLIRLLLVIQQPMILGTGPDGLVACQSGVDRVVSCIMARFGDSGVGYYEFADLMTEQLPNLYNRAFSQISDRFLKPASFSQAANINAPFVQRPGYILTLPLIHQLASFLPLVLESKYLSKLYSGHATQQGAFLALATDQPADRLLLLVKGISDTSDAIVVGAVIAPDEEPERLGRVFELSPVHSVFGSPESRCAVEKEDRGATFNWTISFTSETKTTSLKLQDGLRRASISHHVANQLAHETQLPRVDQVEIWAISKDASTYFTMPV